MRISKNDVSLEDAVRVPNEVAFMTLIRDALSLSFPRPIVPLCFGWADKATGRGWILEEFKEGDVLSQDALTTLDAEKRGFVFEQVARIVKGLQDYELPKTLDTYGGVGFDAEGGMVGAKMVLPCGGPFASYGALLRAMCEWQLAASDRSDIVGGWRENGLRERLDKFLAEGIEVSLAKVPEDRPTVIHADISRLSVFQSSNSQLTDTLDTLNCLVDPSTYEITALLDFDFAHIGAPISEFVLSFSVGLGFTLPGSGDSEYVGDARKYILEGFPTEIPADAKAEGIDLAVSKAFDQARTEVGAKKPSAIEGADLLSDIWWFSQDICQAFWFIPGVLARRTPEQLAEMKKGAEKSLDHYLTGWGY